MIITLKRFEFNMTTMLKEKVNDYFDFPMTINMKPWTSAGIKENEIEQYIDETEKSYYEY